MIRTGLLVAAVVASVSQAEIMEYTLSGEGTLMYEANGRNSSPFHVGDDEHPELSGFFGGPREWTAPYSSTEDHDYTFRFYVDTDNFTSDGMGGYMAVVELASYSFGDGVRAIDSSFVFHVNSDGLGSFETTNASYDVEGFDFSGLDMGSEIDFIQTIEAIQNYCGGQLAPLFEGEHGAAGFSVSTIGFSAAFVDGVPSVPAPGALGVLGLGGLVGLRRRR